MLGFRGLPPAREWRSLAGAGVPAAGRRADDAGLEGHDLDVPARPPRQSRSGRSGRSPRRRRDGCHRHARHPQGGPGRAVLLRPRVQGRQPRPGRQGPRRRRGRPVCAAASRPGEPRLVVATVRDALAPLAAAFFQHPSDRFDLVEGDRHQRQDHHHLHAGGDLPGRRPRSRGPRHRRGPEWGPSGGRPSHHPRGPRPPARLLAEMADAGVQAAAMEVSSHGLALHRVISTAPGSRRPSSPASPRIIWTSTPTSTTTGWLAGACSRRVHAAGGRQPGRPPRAPAGQHGRDRHRDLWHRRRRRRSPTSPPPWRGPASGCARRPGRGRSGCGWPASSTRSTPSAPWPRPTPIGIDLDTAVAEQGKPWPGSAASSGSTPASRSPCWSTTPTPRLPRQRPPGGAGDHQGTGDRGLRLRRRPRPGRSGRSWARSPAAWPTWPWSPPTAPRSRPRRRSSLRSPRGWPAPERTGTWSRSTAEAPSRSPWPWPGRATPS